MAPPAAAEQNQGMNDRRPEDDRLRRKRFGSLPPRVLPADTVESVDTRPVQGRPTAAVSEDQMIVHTAGG